MSQQAPEFSLPAALVADEYSLRPETDADLPFLRQLYESTREEELAQITDWNAAQRQLFLDSQFAAQRHHYRTHIPECHFNVIEHRSTPIGRLYLEKRPTRLHIVDVALMPSWRGIGLGTAILTALIAQARSEGKAVGIFVEVFNPARRLYQRLGFTPFADHGVYLEMEWNAASRSDRVS